VRIALALHGARPTAAALAAVRADPEALGRIVDGYLDDPGFGAVIRDMWNEVLQLRVETRRYMLPLLGPLADRGGDAGYMSAIPEEPLRLIEYVAVNDRPFSAIVTADHAVASDMAIAAWGATPMPADVSCAAFLDTRLDWDTHDDIADQGRSHEQLFAELTQIAGKLDAAGLLERTTVAVLSEFGRTPRLNDQAQPGKDHWPVTSALLFGGGVRPGTYGATDDSLGALPVRMDDGTRADSGQLLRFDNFTAGLLEFMGVSSQRWISNVEPFHGPFA